MVSPRGWNLGGWCTSVVMGTGRARKWYAGAACRGAWWLLEAALRGRQGGTVGEAAEAHELVRNVPSRTPMFHGYRASCKHCSISA